MCGEHKLTRLHWVRGLLRAWIVCSVVWISAVGFFNYESLLPQRTFNIPFANGRTATVRAPAFTTKEQVQQVVNSPDVSEWLQHRFSLFNKPYVPAGWTASADKGHVVISPECVDNTHKTGELVIKPECGVLSGPTLPSAYYVLAIALLPPLALLIAGFMLRWIIRGFRPINPTL